MLNGYHGVPGQSVEVFADKVYRQESDAVLTEQLVSIVQEILLGQRNVQTLLKTNVPTGLAGELGHHAPLTTAAHNVSDVKLEHAMAVGLTIVKDQPSFVRTHAPKFHNHHQRLKLSSPPPLVVAPIPTHTVEKNTQQQDIHVKNLSQLKNQFLYHFAKYVYHQVHGFKLNQNVARVPDLSRNVKLNVTHDSKAE
jgi:hypothetical protein